MPHTKSYHEIHDSGAPAGFRASTRDEHISKWFLFQKGFGQVLIGCGGREMMMGVEEPRCP